MPLAAGLGIFASSTISGPRTATAMAHLAIDERLDGKAVNWMERVSDDRYPAGRS